MSICSWIREAFVNFWKLTAVSGGAAETEATTAVEPYFELSATAKQPDNRIGSGCGVNSSGEGAGYQVIRTKFPFFDKSDPNAATTSGADEGATCCQFYGRLRHCDSRSSFGGPLYRYVSSLSLELQAAISAPIADDAAHHIHRSGDCGSSWQERDIVATQLRDKLASRDLTGAARYCRLLLTLEPYNDEASRLLETLETVDRESPLLYCQDDLVHVGYCSDEMDSDNTSSETQFRYFHHDQHGLNEDERRSRRTTSESDAFLDASSSSESY